MKVPSSSLSADRFNCIVWEPPFGTRPTSLFDTNRFEANATLDLVGMRADKRQSQNLARLIMVKVLSICMNLFGFFEMNY